MTSWLKIRPAAAGWDRGKGKKPLMGILLHRKYKSKDKNTAKAHRVWDGGLERMWKDFIFQLF